MVSATMTIPAIMAEAGGVVSSFDGLIVLVVGISLGLFVVGYLVSKAKSAKRG